MMKAAQILADLTAVDPGTISSSTVLSTLHGWDSLKVVRLVLVIEEKLGRELTEQELEQLSTAGDISQLLKS